MELGVGLGVSKLPSGGGVPKADMLELSASFVSNINAGSPVDGDPVYFMGDTSGNNIDFEMSAFLNQPIYRDSGFGTNNMPCVEFDGINDFLQRLLSGGLSVPYTGFIVSQNTSPGDVLALSTNHYVTMGYFGDKPSVTYGSGDRDILPYVPSPPITDPHLFDWVQKVGIQTTSNWNGNFLMTLNPNLTNPIMGGYKFIGRRLGGNICGMKLAEIRLYNGVLTNVQINAVRGDLNDKFGLY